MFNSYLQNYQRVNDNYINDIIWFFNIGMDDPSYMEAVIHGKMIYEWAIVHGYVE